jgi:glycerol-3-phosphate acyltransferase PlsY
MENPWFAAIVFPLLGYLCGSLPFAVWVTRLVKGVDVRQAGSGHAGATNTFRQAGLGPGLLVLVLDLAKGFLPTWLALRTTPGWVAVLTAGLVIVGHCWPLFAGFRGGMGNASGAGALLAASPYAFLLAVGLTVALMLVIRHSARANTISGLLLAPLCWLLGLGPTVTWIAAAVGLIVAARFLIDWNRKYRELWLDRENASG